MRRLALLVLFATGTAAAQTAAPGAAPARPKCSDTDPNAPSATAGGGGGAGKTKYEVVTGPDGKKIFRIKTGFVICGKVPKPDVLYGLLNTTINYEWETLKQDFMPKVLHSVDETPF